MGTSSRAGRAAADPASRADVAQRAPEEKVCVFRTRDTSSLVIGLNAPNQGDEDVHEPEAHGSLDTKEGRT